MPDTAPCMFFVWTSAPSTGWTAWGRRRRPQPVSRLSQPQAGLRGRYLATPVGAYPATGTTISCRHDPLGPSLPPVMTIDPRIALIAAYPGIDLFNRESLEWTIGFGLDLA